MGDQFTPDEWRLKIYPVGLQRIVDASERRRLGVKIEIWKKERGLP